MIRRLTAAWSLGMGLLAPLAGQGALTAPSSWSFNDSQGSFCVSYLVEPAEAARLAPKESVLTPASAAQGLNIQVARVIRDEPEFGKWIPASVCVGLYADVMVNGQRAATMKPGKPLMFVMHTIAASAYRGMPVAAVTLGVYTDNGDLSRAWERAGQRVASARRTVTPVLAEGRDPKVLFEFDRVKLVWEGAGKGDPRVTETRKVSFGYTAQRGTDWSGVLEVAGGEERSQFGGLGVEGKSSFAKALRASPIRAMGPLETGGKMTISLTANLRK